MSMFNGFSFRLDTDSGQALNSGQVSNSGQAFNSDHAPNYGQALYYGQAPNYGQVPNCVKALNYGQSVKYEGNFYYKPKPEFGQTLPKPNAIIKVRSSSPQDELDYTPLSNQIIENAQCSGKVRKKHEKGKKRRKKFFEKLGDVFCNVLPTILVATVSVILSAAFKVPIKPLPTSVR